MAGGHTGKPGLRPRCEIAYRIQELLGALPLIVAFLLFQRQIAEGIATTGIK